MVKAIFLLSAIVVGILLRQIGWVTEKRIGSLNRVLIFFFIPLLTIVNIPKLQLNLELIWLSISPFLVFIFGFMMFEILAKARNIKQETKQVLILTGGISSTSFVGFPIFEFLYGDLGLSYGILMSVGGTILVFNTLGIGLLFRYSDSTVSIGMLLKKILTFFPFVIFLISLLLNFYSFQFSPLVEDVLIVLAKPFSFLALLAIGMQIDFTSFRNNYFPLLCGQIYKLIMAPLIICLLGLLFFPMNSLVFKISILGAGIGSMNAISIMTAEKKLNPELAIAMPAIGIPLSFFTLFLISLFLK